MHGLTHLSKKSVSSAAIMTGPGKQDCAESEVRSQLPSRLRATEYLFPTGTFF